MNVTYKDRNGKAWAFDVTATPYQAVLFRRVLYAVRSVAQREQFSLSYLANADENDAFLSKVEGAVLSGLLDHYAPTPQEPPTPPYPTLTEKGKLLPTPREATEDAGEDRKPYYWELF